MPVPVQNAGLKTSDNLTVYAVFRRQGDLNYWNTFAGGFEGFASGHWYSGGSNNYANPATKTVQAANQLAEYVVGIPSMPQCLGFIEWYQQLGANPAVTDTLLATTYDLHWSGTLVVELNDVNGKTLGGGSSSITGTGVQATVPNNGIGGTQNFNNGGQTTPYPTSGSGIGPGANACTQTILNSLTSQPIVGASVWISTDSAGKSVIAGALPTNSQGKVTFMLTAGSTYYLWMIGSGVEAIAGKQFIAVAD